MALIGLMIAKITFEMFKKLNFLCKCVYLRYVAVVFSTVLNVLLELFLNTFISSLFLPSFLVLRNPVTCST